jgi:hypothetical protein
VLVFGRVLRAGREEEAAARPVARTVGDLPEPGSLARRAADALRAGDRAGALRLYYLAAVARLRQLGRIPRSTALTGREILAATRPAPTGLAAATGLFERVVYGETDATVEEVVLVRSLAGEAGTS